MDEPVVEKTDPVVEPVKEKNESVVENEPPPDPKPKSKGGRPAGSKDKTPRTRKKITVVEEPLHAPPPAQPVQEPETPKATKPAPKAAPKVSLEPPVEEPVEEPPSPRSVMRSASMNILQLRELTERARRSHLQETYTKRLHRF